MGVQGRASASKWGMPFVPATQPTASEPHSAYRGWAKGLCASSRIQIGGLYLRRDGARAYNRRFIRGKDTLSMPSKLDNRSELGYTGDKSSNDISLSDI
jgi:hypothetical protein